MLVTVAICTWNRAEILGQTLEQMRHLTIPDAVDWELVVVNNNSTDHTEQVLDRYESLFPMRRLIETTQGHSAARNCAIAAARGDYLIWTDDDVRVSPQWLKAYVSAFQQYPKASIFGGPISPMFESKPPAWVLRYQSRLQGLLVTREAQPDGSLIDRNYPPYGANMAFRTSVMKGTGGFNQKLGRCGNLLTWNDDIAMVQGLLDAGHEGRWVADATIEHHVGSERCTSNYYWKLNYGLGVVNARTTRLEGKPSLFGCPAWVYREYLEHSLRSLVLAPFRNAQWLDSLKRSGRSKGYLDEVRRLQRTQSGGMQLGVQQK